MTAPLLKVDGLSPHFVLEVGEHGNMKSLTVHVETEPGSGRPAEDLGRHLAALVKTNVGITAKVVTEAPGSVPRSEGKAQRVRHASG